MSMAKPVAQLRLTRDLCNAETALDGTLLNQTSLLATLITTRREATSEPFLGQTELMRLVKSQQSLLSTSGQLSPVRGGPKKIDREYGRVIYSHRADRPVALPRPS